MEEPSNKYALAALKDKRATLAGEIIQLKKQIAWKQEQLLHLDASIAIFEPGYDARRIRPKRPKERVRLFNQGELGRIVLEVLRRAGEPVTTPAVVTGVLAALGHGETVRPAMRGRVRSCLQYLNRDRKLVIKTGSARETRWGLVERIAFTPRIGHKALDSELDPPPSDPSI
jgi:hypothetical protein